MPCSTHGDRVLPETVANGTVVGANEQLSSGTSFAAPAVAGIAALVQQINPRLRLHPEGCRAILLASADQDGIVRPIDSPLTVDLDLYVKDAAGRLVSLSAPFDNNYEIVEFYARPGDMYELSIVKASGVPNTRYGIAWAAHQVPWAVKRP